MNYIGTFFLRDRKLHRYFFYDYKYIYYYLSPSQNFRIGVNVYYGISLLSDILRNKNLHPFYDNTLYGTKSFNFEVGDIIAVDNNEEACRIVINLLTKIIFDKL